MRFNNQQIKMPKSPVITRDMSCSTITSMPFYQNSPVYIQEVLPGDKVSLNVENFVRLNVMRSPTFGRVTIRNRVFFVPLRTVWSRFDEFISQQSKTHNNDGQLQQVPRIYESNLIALLSTQANGYTNSGTSTNYDYTAISGTTTYNRVFTRKGRYLYRILVNLGYNINFGQGYTNGNGLLTGRMFSALPLLAFYRIWCDFFQYKMSNNYREYDNTLPSSLSNYINYSTLVAICDKLTSWGSMYDDDYFTLAGQSPNIPIYDATGNATGGETIPDYMDVSMVNYDGVAGDGSSSVKGNDISGASAQGNDTAEPTLVSGPLGFGASALNFLQRAADYFQRKFRGGSTVVQQYFNEYGFKLKAEEITHSKHLGSFETPITIGDISGTSADNFGAQTSIGRGAGTNHFSWTSEEFGYIIVTSVVVAHGAYNHGTPRLATRMFPLEFYHEDFDGLGMEAIRNDELASGSITAPSENYKADNTFGFIPTYGSYKVGHDTLSGDFIINSSREAYKGYYLSRLYKPEDYTANPPVAGETFRNPNAYQNGWTPTEFDNIFLTSALDNFLLFFNFDVKVANSVRPLLDNYDWYADGETKNMQGGANAFGDN